MVSDEGACRIWWASGIREAEPLDEAAERARVNGETAKIAWHELQRFFARGATVAVAPELDLLEVAYQMSRDDKTRIARWMDEGRLAKVADEQALQWLEADALVWSVVVKPWVLVQSA